MWFNTLHGEWPEIIREQLYDRMKPISIGQLMSAVDVSTLLRMGELSEAREQTLTYLHTLLTKGQVKAGRVIRLKPGEVMPDPETVKNDPLFEDIPGTPDDIIEYIRKEWNTNPDFSESFDCVIKLPNNPWPT